MDLENRKNKLKKAFKENFDFDLEFENVIKEYDFSNKEEFFMKKLKFLFGI